MTGTRRDCQPSKTTQPDPGDSEALNRLMFIPCTVRNSRIRDRAETLVQAKRASRMTDSERSNTLETIAMAHVGINNSDATADAIAKAIELAQAKEQTKLKAH